MHKDCVYGKTYESKKKTVYKHRIDRSYDIQKTYVNGKLLPENLASEILNCIPNLALLGELSHDTFVEIFSQFDSTYPKHEDVREKVESSDTLGNICEDVLKGNSQTIRGETGAKVLVESSVSAEKREYDEKLREAEFDLRKEMEKVQRETSLDSKRNRD